MAEHIFYGCAYKSRLVSRFPLIKNTIIEVVERRKWNRLLKFLTSSIEVELITSIYQDSDTNEFLYLNTETYEYTTITKEQADDIINNSNAKNKELMQAAWNYNIPVYELAHYFSDDISKYQTALTLHEDGVIFPNFMYS